MNRRGSSSFAYQLASGESVPTPDCDEGASAARDDAGGFGEVQCSEQVVSPAGNTKYCWDADEDRVLMASADSSAKWSCPPPEDWWWTDGLAVSDDASLLVLGAADTEHPGTEGAWGSLAVFAIRESAVQSPPRLIKHPSMSLRPIMFAPQSHTLLIEAWDIPPFATIDTPKRQQECLELERDLARVDCEESADSCRAANDTSSNDADRIRCLWDRFYEDGERAALYELDLDRAMGERSEGVVLLGSDHLRFLVRGRVSRVGYTPASE